MQINTKHWLLFILYVVCSTNVFSQNQVTAITFKNFDSLSSQKILLTGKIITGKIITLDYKTLATNNPQKNKNWIALWQGSQVHYNEKPLRKILLSNSSQSGSIAFDSLEINNLKYVLGFGSNDNISTASATIYFPKGSKESVPFSSSIKVINIGINTIVVEFETPTGNTPEINKNWIGLWKGKRTDSETNFLEKSFIKINTSSGTSTISIEEPFIRGSIYTIVYCIGPDLTDIIASFTFKYN
jgi:hypothetical protein